MDAAEVRRNCRRFGLDMGRSPCYAGRDVDAEYLTSGTTAGQRARRSTSDPGEITVTFYALSGTFERFGGLRWAFRNAAQQGAREG